MMDIKFLGEAVIKSQFMQAFKEFAKKNKNQFEQKIFLLSLGFKIILCDAFVEIFMDC